MATTPNYSIDYEDERFKQVETDKTNAINQSNQTYDNMINESDQFYDAQIQASKDWAETQAKNQQERTDFTIEQIEQQKEKAEKDYLKEQSGAYVDWQKQSNQYGAEAEKMAAAGLDKSGFSESSQVSMYNTYQNRVATAREVYSNAVLNYDNAIKDAQLQNNAVLAEIAYNALEKQLQLGLEGFQYKNQLIIEKANKQNEIDDRYYNRYKDIINQMNTENALNEDIRQFNENMAWQTEENQKNRDFQAKESELDRKFQADQAEINRKFEEKENELNRKHEIAMQNAKTKAEKEILEQQHKNDMAKLAQQQKNELAQLDKKLANDKALLKYENSLKNSGDGSGNDTKKSKISGSSSKSSSKTNSNKTAVSASKTNTSSFTGSSYKDAVSYMKKMGVPSANASGAMTESEWSRRRTSYKNTGQGSTEVKNYNSYSAYIKDYVAYCVEKYGK